MDTMTTDRWSQRNQLLNRFLGCMSRGTHHLIRDLSLDESTDGHIFCEGRSLNYYGVQLAIHEAQRFREMHPTAGRITLVLRVGESLLDLSISGSEPMTDDCTPNPQGTGCHRDKKLAVTTSAPDTAKLAKSFGTSEHATQSDTNRQSKALAACAT